ncbi:MAG: di-heme enzyme [Anaerolineae bacterium]|nr:di-heme enzyme [Anaerolineae bacterium]
MRYAKVMLIGWVSITLLLIAALIAIFSAADSTSTRALSAQRAANYVWQLPPGFPVPNVPVDNPMSEAKVKLGRYLFYDPHLSSDSSYSCASCHSPEVAFSDSRPVAIGVTGQKHPRNTQGLTNVAYYTTLTWANPALTSIEQQVLMPMFGETPVEMGMAGHEEAILGYFQRSNVYRQMFADAFPDEPDAINYQSVSMALASFSRTLISGNSPYDRYTFQGDQTALSPSALRGMKLFMSDALACSQCHAGFNFTLDTSYQGAPAVESPFFNIGLYNLDGKGAYPADNTGLAATTHRAEDMGRFRVPSLRNVALTAPYMHDGSLLTLKDVLGFYAAGGRTSPYQSELIKGFTLTDQDEQDLLNFLHSLTDDQFVNDPRFSNPFTITASEESP